MKLFLAGFGSRVPKELKAFGELVYACPYILESYVYFNKSWQTNLLKTAKIFLLDSGAFTFMHAKKQHNIDWTDFTKKYAEFINKHNIKHFFELDIDSIIGLSEVEKLRNLLEKETGKKSIPVWHINRGKQYWLDMCDEYNYVGIGGVAGAGGGRYANLFKRYVNWFTSEAKKRNCKVHGLGMTSNVVKNYGFYSIDSTSWLAGARFGHVHTFRHDKLITYSPGKGKRRANHYSEVDVHNLGEWLKYQKYLERF